MARERNLHEINAALDRIVQAVQAKAETLGMEVPAFVNEHPQRPTVWSAFEHELYDLGGQVTVSFPLNYKGRYINLSVWLGIGDADWDMIADDEKTVTAIVFARYVELLARLKHPEAYDESAFVPEELRRAMYLANAESDDIG